jgi:AcrR family transcriptional regulator
LVNNPETAVRNPEATRARILEAATKEFARHGIGGARVDRIATRAGANKAMLYYYFGDKDGLFRDVLENTYEGIRSAEGDLHLLELGPVDAVARLVEFTWRYYLAHPEFLSLLNSENLHGARHLKGSRKIRTTNSPLVATLSRVLKRGEAEGAFRRGVDPLHLYISIAALAYFYLSNNHTLSQAFDRDLGTAKERDKWLAHIVSVITGYLARRDGKAGH